MPAFTERERAEFENRFKHCLQARQVIENDPQHRAAFRLFNGYAEGCKGLVVDLYGRSIVISDHSRSQNPKMDQAREFLIAYLPEKLPFIQAILSKQRHNTDAEAQRGKLVWGEKLTSSIEEEGVRYALDLRLNQDESFYMDNRNLRQWLQQESQGKSILNTFAYTGTLGVAALAGGARRVVQTDLNASFLSLARKSAAFGHHSGQMILLPLDFFRAVSRFKTSRELFDTVLLDPPYFSVTPAGKVDLLHDWIALINKVRPLVAHEGRLVVINNALFASGEEVQAQLQTLCANGFLELEAIVPVPEDCTGFGSTVLDKPVVDPAPYNHATKITVLRVRRKDKRRAEPLEA